MRWVRLVLVAASLLLPATAAAALPELKVAPLLYNVHLDPGHPKDGFIDTSNPTGSTIHIKFEVQAFRQINNRGELQFYDDDRIRAGIVPATSELDLPPRAAVRTRFKLDPAALGPGGAYGVIFARTVDTAATAQGLRATSARVGTLIIADVGGGGTRSGQIANLQAPWLLLGNGDLPITFTYQNRGSGDQALAFAPTLSAGLGWLGKAQKVTGPFVFPGRTRGGQASLVTRNQLGLVPLAITDPSGHSAPTGRWVVLICGFWLWLLPLLALLVGAALSPARWWGLPKSKKVTQPGILSAVSQPITLSALHAARLSWLHGEKSQSNRKKSTD